MADDDTRGGGANSVLGKARLILESFELDDDSLTLTEIVARTGMSKATVHRLNQELLEWGMLERIGLEYRLGMRAFELGSRVPRFRVLRDAVRPYMESLHHQTREAVHLAVLRRARGAVPREGRGCAAVGPPLAHRRSPPAALHRDGQGAARVRPALARRGGHGREARCSA